MKKFFVMAVAAMMATMSVHAQNDDPKNEIGISYGVGLSLLGDGIGDAVSTGLVGGIFGYKYENYKEFGTLSVEYFRHLNNPRWAVGGIIAYARSTQDVMRDNGSKYIDRTRNYYTVMPAAKYYWVNKSHFGLYSKAAVGVMIVNVNEKLPSSGESKSENELRFMGQLSALGLEAGAKHVRAFIEAGVGEQGIVLAGVRAKF